MADKEIAMLPQVDSINDETKLLVYNPNALNPAQHATGAQLAAFAREGGAAAMETAGRPLVDAVAAAAASAAISAKQAADQMEDVRTGYDGTVYPTAGEAVRGQVKEIVALFGIESLKSKNLLNLATITPNQNFNASGSIINSTTYSMTDNIPVSPGQVLSFQYLFNGIPAIGNMRFIVAYDADGNILDIQADIATYTIPDNAATIRFTAANTRLFADSQPMFFEGTEVSEYEEYYEREVLDYNVKAENVLGLEKACYEAAEKAIAEMDTSGKTYFFRKVDSACDSYSNESNKVELQNHDSVDAVYGMYDALVAAHPDYVTKTLLGTIENGALPIYRYDFTPKLPIDSKMERLCKILYCSGTHGGENAPIMVGVRFFKDLCENWRKQDLLRSLHFNCQFTVIPLVNPYGFIHATRQNENRVDLNRNFTNGWHNGNNLVVGDTNYPGPGPASETSTQLIEGMTASEPFDFVIDHHTYGSYTATGKAGYFVSNNSRPQDVSFANMLAVWMNGKVMSDNTLINDFSKSHWQTMIGTGPGCGGYLYGAVQNGFCFENMHIWGDNEMEAVVDSQKFNAETIGAIFLSCFIGYHTY